MVVLLKTMWIFQQNEVIYQTWQNEHFSKNNVHDSVFTIFIKFMQDLFLSIFKITTQKSLINSFPKIVITNCYKCCYILLYQTHSIPFFSNPLYQT